jgi:ABC-2 type transport system permease protein
MKLSEFKESIRERWVLIKANTLFTAQRELAYAGNNWAGFMSTFLYTVTALLFIKVVYSNVQTVAGYSYNQMLLYFLVYQFTYYANFIITFNNLNDLIPDVNNGNLDMILVKPVPSLYFLMTRSLSIVSVVSDATPPIVAIALLISWKALSFSFGGVIIAIIVWILGLITMHTFQLLATIPVFWFGDSDNILDLAYATSSASNMVIPLQGYSPNLQKLFGTVIPTIIASGFTASILLGKSDPIFLLAWASLAALAALIVRDFAWKLALKHYASASS